ncbi:MAG: PQQ-binding-like beta-propeller repeat protein [Chloroflexi bacterium]|nr:PQQ-binding-like beta-propeller repeat protein [Chloroflexota bacterium]
MIVQHFMRLPALLVAALLLLAACVPAPTTTGWNWAGSTPARSGVYVGTYTGKVIAIDDAGNVRWEFSAAGEQDAPGLAAIYGRPAATADAVYAGSHNGKVYRLDAATGAKTWEQSIGTPIVATPAVGATAVYVSGNDGKLRALAPADGRKLWELVTAGPIWATPTVTEGALYVASMDHHLYAVDPDTGREQWRFEAKAPLLTSPVLAGGLIYVGGVGQMLYRVDAATGRQVGSFTARNWFWAEPLIVGGTVYAASLDHQLYALDVRTFQPQRAPFLASGPIRSAPALLAPEGIIVVGSQAGENAGKVYGLDAASGEKRWEQNVDSPVLAPIAVADGKAYVTTAHDVVYAFDATGRKLWEARLPGQK